VSGKKKLTARKKLLDSEEEKAEEGEGEGEGEQREMETDTVPVAGPSGLNRSQVSSWTVSRKVLNYILICTFCVCADDCPGFSKLFTTLHIIKFVFASLKLLTN
jgi:hypothetical protein